MKEKIKKIILGYLPGFITGLIICGGISVIAATYFPSNDVTYDNSESGLSSTNVQGAIDELYDVCFPPKAGSDIITDLLPNNSDELYEDEHGDIRYYGANPNNYVYFNCSDINSQKSNTCELWRILGIIDGKIKIIKHVNLGTRQWSLYGYGNNWNNSNLKSYLNDEYYNGIKDYYRNMISEEIYYLGGVTNDNAISVTTSEYYDVERSSKVYSHNPTSVKQYIGLIYPSDYGYASGENCLDIAIFRFNSNLNCVNNNYLHSGVDEWLQSPSANASTHAALLYDEGYVGSDQAYGSHYVRPSLYLVSETKIIGGDGSQSTPYELSL